METRGQIETNLIELLARLINQYNGDGPPRGISKDLQCSRPELGRWIAGFDFPLLIETLRLSDRVFTEEFPGLGLTLEYRNQFAAILEGHCQQCEFCKAKKFHDEAWQKCTDKALAENKEIVGQVLTKAAGKL